MNCLSRLKCAACTLLVLSSFSAWAQDNANVLIVDLYLNQQRMGDTFVLQDQDGSFLVEEAVLREWQILEPWPEPVLFHGNNYYPINQFFGAESEFVARRMELQVSMPANLMPLRTVDFTEHAVNPYGEEIGTYVDYDVNWLSQESDNSESVYALLRPVFFGEFGNVTANLGYHTQSGGSQTIYSGGKGLNVLSLTYTRDDPSRMRSLQIGDVVSRSGSQGNALRIGGIQLATNFSTQPTFITYPLPSFYGETTVPSALDIYVNGQLRRSQNVQAGQYVLEDIPVVNGAGQMQVVTRDAMGRQQVYSQDFYVSSDLLRKGLSDYSFNLGALREDYGVDNFRYGALAGSANYRYGIGDDLTIEGHGEFSGNIFMLGSAAQYAVKNGGTLKGGLGISSSSDGLGSRWQLGFRQISEILNYNVEISGSTRKFGQVSNYSEIPKFQLVASAGKSFYEFGNFGLSIVQQRFWEKSGRLLISANHSKTLSNFLSLSSYISYVNADNDDIIIGVRFSMPFGDRYNVHGGLSANRSGPNLETVLRRNMPTGSGYGYHVGVGFAENTLVNAGVMAQSEYGTYMMEVRDSNDSGSVWQAGTYGSLAYLSGMTRFSRRIRDAFAVVSVGGLEGVRVYAENQEIGRTDKNGQVFVPGLYPYHKNQLRIEIDDLPLNASVGNTRADTMPYYRSGVVVNFDVRISNNVLFRAVLPDGSPVPEGAIVHVQYPDKRFPVGIDGKVYLEGIDRSSLVEIRWNGASCELDVPFAAGSAIIEKLGDILCEPELVH